MKTRSHCPACQALSGKPADIDPHNYMRGDTYSLAREGVTEVYTCRKCGTKSERFVATKAFGAQSGSWKTLKR